VKLVISAILMCNLHHVDGTNCVRFEAETNRKGFEGIDFQLVERNGGSWIDVELCLCDVCTAGLLSRMKNSHLFISRKDGAEKEVTSPRFWLISLMWVRRRWERGRDG